MVQKFVVQLVDDLSGEEIESGVTVRFGLDGAAYVIDLSEANADEFRSVVAPYVLAARRDSGVPLKPAPVVKRDLHAVREWAAANGYEVSSRGRIPAAVQDAYDATH